MYHLLLIIYTESLQSNISENYFQKPKQKKKNTKNKKPKPGSK